MTIQKATLKNEEYFEKLTMHMHVYVYMRVQYACNRKCVCTSIYIYVRLDSFSYANQ